MSEDITARLRVKPSQAMAVISDCLLARLVPMLHGSPGCGKSDIVHQVAEEFNLMVIDERLSQCDPTDLKGFGAVVNGVAKFIPMDTFPLAGQELPINPKTKEPYAGWLLFLDEFNSAPPAVQAAAYKLVLDRMVGQAHLHENVAIVCAGNLETDGAIVEPMSTAMQSRMVHLELVVDAKEWCEWAANKGLDHRIASFIEFKPDLLYTFNPEHTDKTYACPRTWEFSSRILKISDIGQPTNKFLLAGALSDGVALEFTTFCKLYDELPKMKDILGQPKTSRMPDEPGTLYALTGALSHNMTVDNLDPVLTYIKRMPAEFQIVCLRQSARRHKHIIKEPAFVKWQQETAEALF